MELGPAPICMSWGPQPAPANVRPCEIWSLCVEGVRSHFVHTATVLLRVSTVVAFYNAFCAALGAEAEITASVPAGVH